MPRTAATITQADVARCIRAAKQSGAYAVEVWPDGRIIIVMQPPKTELDDEREIIL